MKSGSDNATEVGSIDLTTRKARRPKNAATTTAPRKRLANMDHDTRDRVLRVAIREFALHGFDGPSIRDLTIAAGVNQAAINYHFGSKDGLIKTIFDELATPLIEERLAGLNQLEHQADGSPLTLETIIRVMVEPVVRRAKEGKDGQRELAKLLLIASSLGSKPIEHQIETMHDELALRFVDAITRAVPHLSRVEVMWRYKFTLGALLYTLSDHMQNHRLRRLSKGECDTENPNEILDNLVPYLVAGFISAPPRTSTAMPVPIDEITAA
jgi:AcrR family transcriptional regulator